MARNNQQRSTSRNVAKSSSDSEIAHGKGKGKGQRKSKAKERWPFVEGLTVDELARYRRRRVQDQPKDNLQLHQESTTRDPASEYRRAFGVTSIEEFSKENVRPVKVQIPKGYSGTEEIVEDAQSLTDLAQGEANVDLSAKENVLSQFVDGNDDGNEAMQMRADDTAQLETSFERSPIIRSQYRTVQRGTSLKCDGDFCTNTETYSAYVPYEGQHRAELARRPTSLKMEGDLDTMTEKCEKFIEWLNVSRPELMRVPTHLRMEGELETATENQDRYIPFVGARRPELLRRSTNLKLEGDTYFVPEYTDVFRDYSVKDDCTIDKLQSMRPQTHLKTGGDFFQDTESTEYFAHSRAKQMQEMTEQFKDEEDNVEDKRRMREQEEKRRKDEEMKMLVSKLEDLNGRPLEIPEYRDAYKDFPRERPRIAKPNDEIGRADGSKVSSPSRSKFSMKIDQDPEYQSKYLEYSRDRPIYRKSPLMLRPTGISSSGHSMYFARRMHPQECHAYEYKPISEVQSQYVPYGHVSRVETLKKPTNLQIEDNYEFQPENKNVHCARYDRQSCREPGTTYCRSDRSPRRRENYWLSDGNIGQCDRAVAQDLDAFHVLDTRLHEDNVTGKPPPASRRSSRHSQITVVPRSTQLELADRTIMKTRSPSPTYRLHVCDVDNEPRGFGRQSSGRIRSPSADRVQIQDNVAKPYSPSFGRNKQDCRRGDNQPFVVLASASKNASCGSETFRRKRTDRNVDGAVPISRRRPRTPTRWMPPWYDNTNTI